jgi:YbaB/EbfC DNA-binding family protein
MNDAPGDKWARRDARTAQSASALADIAMALDGAHVTASSGRGQVVATVDRSGHLVSLEFVDVTLTRVPAAELGRQVVAAVSGAQAVAAQTFLEMLVDRLGPLPEAVR